MPRPYVKLPHGARDHLERMAENGMLSELRAATALGMPLKEFRRVIADHPPSKKIWQDALDVERDQLLDALYQRAVGGDTRAAQTLLAVRHGLSEKGADGRSGAVTVNFNLPAAMSAKDYLEAITVEPEALPDGTGPA